MDYQTLTAISIGVTAIATSVIAAHSIRSSKNVDNLIKAIVASNIKTSSSSTGDQNQQIKNFEFVFQKIDKFLNSLK